MGTAPGLFARYLRVACIAARLTAALAFSLMLTACVGTASESSPTRASTVPPRATTNPADHDAYVEQLRRQFEKDRSASNQIELAEAEADAAEAHMALARKYRAERRPRLARQELTAALGHVPAHPQAITMAREVDRDIQRAEDLTRQAVAAKGKKDEVGALRLAEQALALDSTVESARQIANETRGPTLQALIQEAVKAFEQGQWDAAQAAASKASQIDSSNARMKEIATQAANRKQAMQSLDAGKAAAAQGDDAAAIKAIDDAIVRWPENSQLAAERNRIIQAAVDRHIAKGDAECAAGRFPAGMIEYDKALVIAPGNAKVAQHREKAIAQRLQKLRDAYERLALAGKWELAWAEAVYLAALGPADEARAVQSMARAEKAIRSRIACRLRVIPLPGTAGNSASAQAVARELFKELERIKPPHYKLIPFEATTDAATKTPLTLADVTKADKLKTLSADLTESDMLLFIGVTSHPTASPRPAASPRGSTDEQAKLDLRQAKEELGRARRLALADERKWDPDARHALNTDETFLPKAAAGTYGVGAQRAAENYNAALRQLHEQSGTNGRDSRDGLSSPAIKAGVRLRLVQATTGRLLWADDEIETTVEQASGGDAAGLEPTAIRRIIPLLENKARETYIRRSVAYLDDARKIQGENATPLYVRFLFDLSSDPGPYVVTQAIDEVFDKLAGGEELEACRKRAAERLSFRLASPATLPAPQITAGAPAPPEKGPEVPAPTAGKGPAPTPLVTPTGITVFDGYLSNDDDNIPRERALIDDISICVKDTDADPLDTDLEIRVGRYEGKFKGLRVGRRLRIRGASGREYRLTILAIDDDTETIRLSLERASEQPR